jgi:hypothetical protein
MNSKKYVKKGYYKNQYATSPTWTPEENEIIEEIIEISSLIRQMLDQRNQLEVDIREMRKELYAKRQRLLDKGRTIKAIDYHITYMQI